ncbi:MAG TPA: type IV pilus modification protein PilV [Steroidobacter sp.]|uniref:type IV pilus modification protein PilV n=1 Tax=Steroidobacter sp. TaxID=1978227 RepID=UPI002ED7B7AC
MKSARSLPRASRNARRIGGMTIIEVLVTLVIVSVGLLGVVALQLTTLRNNQNASVRSQAAMLASDMLDRMRSNRYDRTTGEGPERFQIGIGEDEVPATTAGDEIRRWRLVLDEQLPEGRGGIDYDDDTNLVTITIQWGERSENPDERILSFETSSEI